MDISSKLAGEVKLFSWDFSAELGENETLTGTPAFDVTDAGTGLASTALTVGTAAAAEGVVQAKVSGGVAGSMYFVTCTSVTSAGQTLEVRGGITVG